ncbi:MAG: magnesium transporter MgtE N-terminal domain-containing protein, partial [bacterium]
LSQEFAASHTIEAAKVLEEMSTKERISYLDEISPELGAQLVQLMAPSLVSGDLERMAEERTAKILTHLRPDSASLFLRRMDEERRVAVLSNLPEAASEEIRVLLSYPENTAGALMEPNVFTLFEDETAKEAVSRISKHPGRLLYYTPVIDRRQALKGLVCIKELMRADSESSVVKVMESGFVPLLANLRRDAIIGHPGWRFFHDLPVVDERGCFLGVVGYRVLRHLESENQKQPRASAFSDSSRALGELYWLGISAFVKGTSSLVTDKER